jgi:hypothetical protein
VDGDELQELIEVALPRPWNPKMFPVLPHPALQGRERFIEAQGLDGKTMCLGATGHEDPDENVHTEGDVDLKADPIGVEAEELRGIHPPF